MNNYGELEYREPIYRPMSLSQILDNSFRIYGKNILSILIFSALIGGIFILLTNIFTLAYLPSNLDMTSLMSLLENPNADITELLDSFDDLLPRLMLFQGLVFFISIIYSILVKPFVDGGIINISYMDHLGNKMAAKEALLSTKNKYGRLILTNLALMVYAIAMFFIFLIVGFLIALPMAFWGVTTFSDPQIGKVLGFIFITIMAIFIVIALVITMSLFITFAYQSAVIEGKQAFKAIKNSFKMVYKKFWRVFGYSIVFSLIIGGINMALSFFFLIFNAVSIVGIGTMISAYITAAFVNPLLLIMTTLLYMDIKARLGGKLI